MGSESFLIRHWMRGDAFPFALNPIYLRLAFRHKF
jgi:hypothetical protein